MGLLRPSLLIHTRLPLPRSLPLQTTSLSSAITSRISRITHPFSTTLASSQPKTDTDKKSALLDREAVNTESNEYSKCGSDASAAREDDPAFRPGKTDPESELASSKKAAADGMEDGGNPLDVSPANHEISQPRDSTEGGRNRKGG